MKRVIFIASQKGGAGKSTFARALLDQLRAEQLSVAAFDADGNVGQLLQYAGSRGERGVLLHEQDPFQGCGYFDIYDPDERDQIVNALALEAERLLFDLPGGALTPLCQVLDAGDAPDGLINEYRHAGYRLTVVVVMTPVLASVRTVQNTIHLFGADVDYIAVRNLAFGDEDAFVLFDGVDDDDLKQPPSKGKQALLDGGGQVINLPALAPRTYALLDYYSLGFHAACHDERVPLADQARVRQWLERFKTAIGPVNKLLGWDGMDAR